MTALFHFFLHEEKGRKTAKIIPKIDEALVSKELQYLHCAYFSDETLF